MDFLEINLESYSVNKKKFKKEVLVKKKLSEHIQFDALVRGNPNSSSVIVFLPSAQSKSEMIKNPVFHRWSWGAELSDCTVITLSDPSIYKNGLHGCWFLSCEPDLDYIDELSLFITEIIKKTNKNVEKIMFYGSSMGGFGALMLASKFKNSCAVAEVPQLNLTTYPFKSVKNSISKIILKEQDIDLFYLDYPHRISVIDRFIKERNIPSFRILTNRCDDEFNEHFNFLSEITRYSEYVDYIGTSEICIIPGDIGHRPMPKSHGLKEIKDCLSRMEPSISHESPTKIKDIFEDEYILEIISRIPPFNEKYDFRNIKYKCDGEYAHLWQYSINGADPDSDNKVTKVNGGLKSWSLWHRSGRKDNIQLQTAIRVGNELIECFNHLNIIPLDPYNSGYYSYNSGWHSGIQLKNIALWARLSTIETDRIKKELYLNAIDKMLDSYLRPIDSGGILANLSDVDKKYSDYWLPQEYPIPNSNRQRHVLNGAQFAVLALYDAGYILRDERILNLANTYNNSLLLVAELSSIESSHHNATSYGIEYYTGLDEKPSISKAQYHLTHCVLAAILYKVSQNKKWLELANRWIGSCTPLIKKGKEPSINLNELSFSGNLTKTHNSLKVDVVPNNDQETGNDFEYAFYLLKNGIKVQQAWYSPESYVSFNVDIDDCDYSSIIFVKHKSSGLIKQFRAM